MICCLLCLESSYYSDDYELRYKVLGVENSIFIDFHLKTLNKYNKKVFLYHLLTSKHLKITKENQN
jgi:hypothetical protein